MTAINEAAHGDFTWGVLDAYLEDGRLGPMVPGGGLVVSRAGAERFATEARDARVVDVDTDHFAILISPPAISVVERFVGAGVA